MKILDIAVEKREKLGSANSRRYRRAGKVPCVLYGGGRDSVPLVSEEGEFTRVLGAHTALVRLTLGEVVQTALVRDVTWDTYGDRIEHVDLQRVHMEDEIELAVPLHFLGVPAGAAHGGVLHVIHPELMIHTRVDSIPEEIEYDISHMEVGDRIIASDLTYPPHVRPAVADDELVAHVKEPRVHVEPEPEAEPAEGEKPAEGEAGAAEGEAAAEGAEKASGE